MTYADTGTRLPSPLRTTRTRVADRGGGLLAGVQSRVGEDLGPFAEPQVRGDDTESSRFRHGLQSDNKKGGAGIDDVRAVGESVDDGLGEDHRRSTVALRPPALRRRSRTTSTPTTNRRATGPLQAVAPSWASTARRELAATRGGAGRRNGGRIGDRRSGPSEMHGA